MVAACSKGSSGGDAECEGLKAKYLAWNDAQVKQVLAEDDEAHKAKDTADADLEHKKADANFIGACHRMKIDPTCWVERKDRAPACKDNLHQLEGLLYAN